MEESVFYSQWRNAIYPKMLWEAKSCMLKCEKPEKKIWEDERASSGCKTTRVESYQYVHASQFLESYEALLLFFVDYKT